MRPGLASLAGLLLAALMALPGSAQDRKALERQFRDFLDQTVWPQAKAAGVARKVFTASTGPLALVWSLPDLRPPGTTAVPRVQEQAEFRGPAAYFSEKRINGLVQIGRAKLSQWDKTLAGIESRYGVSRRIIVAIWGRESDYGRAKLPYAALDVIATQAFMGRRQSAFQNELVAALLMIQKRHTSPAAMKSSWAGAMGHPQFLPTAYLKYAVDHDGDGHANIWTSVPDALASIANYLSQNGWRGDRDWGFESDIPRSISCTWGGPDQGRPIAEWNRLGAQRVAGRSWPQSELSRHGYLMMPSGRLGPTFVVTENFYVLKTYNESDLYALYIGHLADRYGKNRGFVGKWQPVGGFSRGDVKQMQDRLIAKGHDVGGADGLIGFKTRRSVGRWQESKGRASTCFPSTSEVKSIR